MSEVAESHETHPEIAPGLGTVLGVVVIGRNEGERLRGCLGSVAGRAEAIVYVDSGSTDRSVDLARVAGVDVVMLDPALPFTAARARNAGFRHLRQKLPGMEFVQFVDGDCELNRHWLATAVAMMRETPEAAVICGRRRERAPEASLYNHICDMEWNTPCGEARSCGGDALMRVAAFEAAGGFDDGLIAGEEPDLCHRYRRAGWKIFRVAREMTLHDAAMSRFSQWWLRNRRSGYATAEAFHRRRAEDPRLWKQVISNMFWSFPLALPLWPILWWRVARAGGAICATFTMLGKLPHCQGQIQYLFNNLRAGRGLNLIEYK